MNEERHKEDKRLYWKEVKHEKERKISRNNKELRYWIGYMDVKREGL